MGAAPRLEHPVPSRGGQTGCPQHPDVRPAAASPPRPQPRPGLGWPTPEERGEPAMEGAPAPPAGSLPRRRRAELRGSGRGPGVTEGCPAGPDSGRALCVHRSPILPHRSAPPVPAAPAAPRSCLPQAASRSAGAGWMQRCARQGRPVRAREARESPAGRGRAPPAPGVAPRCLSFRAAGTGGGNLSGARRRAKAARGARPSPRSSSPPRRAPAPARCPAPGAGSPQPAGSRCSDQRRCRSSGPGASGQAAPPRPPPGSGSEAKSGGRRAPSGRCVRRPRSRPRLCSARSELQVKPRGSPAEAPPRRPAPALVRSA